MKYNGLQPIQHTKNYSKWVFNLKLNLYSFREKKKKRKKILTIWAGKIFLHRTSKAQNKPKTIKWMSKTQLQN